MEPWSGFPALTWAHYHLTYWAAVGLAGKRMVQTKVRWERSPSGEMEKMDLARRTEAGAIVVGSGERLR